MEAKMLQFETEFGVVLADDVDLDLFTTKTGKAKKIGVEWKGSRPYVRRNGYWVHKVILERKIGRKLLPTEVTDHIHGNTLDDRRSELRVATRRQSAQNRGLQANNKCGYKGVHYMFNPGKKRYQAQIGIDGRLRTIGCFETPEEAARAYDREARKHFGEFARPNFPE